MDGAIDTFLRQKLDGRALDEKLIKKTADALLRRGHSWQDVGMDSAVTAGQGWIWEEME